MSLCKKIAIFIILTCIAAGVLFEVYRDSIVDYLLSTVPCSYIQNLNSASTSRNLPEEPEVVRVIKPEELAAKTADKGGEIWLAVLGEVFDVSKGSEYYASGGYSIFAGRDGSVSFVTGVFTPEEAAKSVEVLEPSQLKTVNDWREFYLKEEKYPKVGVLEGYLYDKDGKPTELLLKLRDIIEEEKVKAVATAAERQAKIKARKEKKQKEQEEKEKAEKEKAAKEKEMEQEKQNVNVNEL